MAISLNELLQHLVAYNNTPSSFGTQLERLLYGQEDKVDPYQALASIEHNLMSNAPIHRMVSDLTNTQQLSSNGRYPALLKFYRRHNGLYSQGAIVVAVLRIYQEWASYATERALANIYSWINPHNKRSQRELHESFAKGDSKTARGQAISLYSDCLVAAADFVETWNKREGAANRARKAKFQAVRNKRLGKH